MKYQIKKQTKKKGTRDIFGSRRISTIKSLPNEPQNYTIREFPHTSINLIAE